MSKNLVCEKCKKQFDPNNQKLEESKKGKFIHCPFCRLKYVFINYATGFIRQKDGSLRRKDKKIRMSKKERLRLRRLQQSAQIN